MPKTILVIEDDIDISSIIETVLDLHNFNFVGVNNADNILELIGKYNPDLVLTDYMLPGLTGGRICQLIKNNKNTSHVPVILMSAYHKLALSGLDFKYDAYISKPFEIDKLISTIRKLLN